MITRMFAVYDGVATAFATPFFMRSDAEAIRAFGMEVNNPSSQLHRSHSDYTLHVLGEFDDASGEIVPGSKLIAKATALLTPVVKEDV